MFLSKRFKALNIYISLKVKHNSNCKITLFYVGNDITQFSISNFFKENITQQERLDGLHNSQTQVYLIYRLYYNMYMNLFLFKVYN